MHYVIGMSGSCGNLYLFYTGRDTLVIDCGVTFTRLNRVLSSHDIPLSSLRALFLTHLHPDHARGVGVLQRRTGIPVYLSSNALAGNEEVIKKERIELNGLKTFMFGEEVEIPGFTVTSFATSHDSTGSAGFSFTSGSHSYFLMTDTGLIPEEAVYFSRKADIKFIEANYDEEMLDHSPYPERLRKRIRGERGHLSNEEAVRFAEMTSKRGDTIHFVHLSENSNRPDILRALVSRIPSGIFCRVCERGEMMEGFSDD